MLGRWHLTCGQSTDTYQLTVTQQIYNKFLSNLGPYCELRIQVFPRRFVVRAQ